MNGIINISGCMDRYGENDVGSVFRCKCCAVVPGAYLQMNAARMS